MGTLTEGCVMRSRINFIYILFLGLSYLFQNSHCHKINSIEDHIEQVSKELGVPEWRVWNFWLQFQSLQTGQAEYIPLKTPESSRKRQDSSIRMVRLRRNLSHSKLKATDLPMIRLRRNLNVVRLKRSLANTDDLNLLRL